MVGLIERPATTYPIYRGIIMSDDATTIDPAELDNDGGEEKTKRSRKTKEKYMKGRNNEEKYETLEDAPTSEKLEAESKADGTEYAAMRASDFVDDVHWFLYQANEHDKQAEKLRAEANELQKLGDAETRQRVLLLKERQEQIAKLEEELKASLGEEEFAALKKMQASFAK